MRQINLKFKVINTYMLVLNFMIKKFLFIRKLTCKVQECGKGRLLPIISHPMRRPSCFFSSNERPSWACLGKSCPIRGELFQLESRVDTWIHSTRLRDDTTGIFLHFLWIFCFVFTFRFFWREGWGGVDKYIHKFNVALVFLSPFFHHIIDL